MKITVTSDYLLETGHRANQEDCLWPGEVRGFDDLYILCDGMGGHEYGEIASRAVCDSLSSYIIADMAEGRPFSFHTFESALDHTYDRLDMLENRDSEKKMGTTMTLLMFCAEGAFAAHIGDSRIYHIRPSETGSARIRFVTSDHSLVNELVAVGVMSKEEASHSSRRNILTKAMMPFQGKRDKPSCTFIHDVRPGDYFFMCSDGMLENLDDNDIANILSMELAEGDKTKLFRRMTASNDDNHSAYIIKVLSVSPE